jgi:hypothetical protein
MTDEFYVGYFPKSPKGIARIAAAGSVAILVAGLTAGVLLAVRQPSFASSRFEFGADRDYAGDLENWPAPMLLTADARYLLVAPGKHGLVIANELIGRKVHLRGSLIERGADRMLEVERDSIRAETSESNPAPAPPRVDLGEIRLTGEIVDTKCYLGVMNPGEGKVHRGCAARCIAGGVPPAFAVRDATGEVRTLLLIGTDHKPIGQQLAGFAAEPVEISGRLSRSGSSFVLETDPSRIRRQ